jgi:hypothetical protein
MIIYMFTVTVMVLESNGRKLIRLWAGRCDGSSGGNGVVVVVLVVLVLLAVVVEVVAVVVIMVVVVIVVVVVVVLILLVCVVVVYAVVVIEVMMHRPDTSIATSTIARVQRRRGGDGVAWSWVGSGWGRKLPAVEGQEQCSALELESLPVVRK